MTTYKLSKDQNKKLIPARELKNNQMGVIVQGYPDFEGTLVLMVKNFSEKYETGNEDANTLVNLSEPSEHGGSNWRGSHNFTFMVEPLEPGTQIVVQ